ncbi:hypothetical protein [Rhodococcus qingshengii]|uniref:hypothetical protein n=1 Tax=Rhodococcus qingshengii TaxID=334542 RepID=UPI001C5F03E7|nr:hypothetical protein [Rhodococcus qingshengii]MBW4813465.1 hypothetical protein [Rhodococcus qingshengii]
MAAIGDPIPMQFLPIADETWEVITDDLVRGYQLPNYPGTRIGSAMWFALANDDTTAGVIWTNHDDGCGILPLDGYDPTSFTAAALTIRLMREQGFSALDTFTHLASDEATYSGDLAALRAEET